MNFTLLFVSFYSIAQNGSNKKYFFPIRPGEVNYLSGSMGEIRSNHFHAGIDIKTGGVQGLPVYATDDGYVARIRVATGGYGNALYLQHPDGRTSVYAHLWKFGDKIAEYVRAQQYSNESFEIELFPDKEQFNIKKGEVIGLSGNSGSSGGPHLHFEIRNPAQVPLNPLSFGFSEIRDDIAPSVQKLALITLDKNSRINHQFGRFEFDLIRKGNNYTLAKPVEAYGIIGVQLYTYDQLNGASNRNGVPVIIMKLDDQILYDQDINKVAFDETRDILAFYDYPHSQKGGRRFQKLYRDDGNELKFYRDLVNDGKIIIRDEEKHQVNILLQDAHQNQARVEFILQGSLPKNQVTDNLNNAGYQGYLVENNILKFYLRNGEMASLYSERKEFNIQPAYKLNQHSIYLWNLNQGLPDSIIANDLKLTGLFNITVPSEADFTYYHRNMDVFFPRKALFDTLFLSLDYRLSGNLEIFRINSAEIPLRSNIQVTLKPKLSYNNKAKTSVYAVNNQNNFSYEGGEWSGEKIKFRTRDFGEFTLLQDTLSPEIRAVKVNSETLSFVISDRLSGIASFKASVDGKWVLMNYDYKQNLIWSEKLDPKQPFEGEVYLEVTDNANNKGFYQTKL